MLTLPSVVAAAAPSKNSWGNNSWRPQRLADDKVDYIKLKVKRKGQKLRWKNLVILVVYRSTWLLEEKKRERK